ncbi:hypothetical protein SANTM175S_06762 [Streptomyces antimycoticus]
MTLRCRMGSLRFLLAMIEHATRRVPTALSSGPLPGPIVAPDQPADRGQSAGGDAGRHQNRHLCEVHPDCG